MVLNYITVFSLEVNRSNKCLLRERKVALWPPWGRSKLLGKKVQCNGMCQARDVQHQAASSSLCKEGETAVKSKELLGVEREPQKYKNNAVTGCCSRASLLIALEGKDQPVRT